MTKQMYRSRNLRSFILITTLFLSTPGTAQVIYHRDSNNLSNAVKNPVRIQDEGRPRVGLVLSGGGARGIAQIGVLRGFEKHNIPIDLIIGTSIGSVIGGYYASGLTVDELESSMKKINWDDLFRDQADRQNLFLGQKVIDDRYLFSVRFDGMRAFIPTSFTSGQKLLSMLTEVIYKTKFPVVDDFNELEIPFRAIATDLISGQRIVIGKGDLAEAINASIAVPLLFSPVVWDDRWLVDGGLSANFAVDVAKSLGMDIVIVVDNTSPLRGRNELNAPWEIADQVTTIMMQSKNREQSQLADLVIKPDLQDIGSTDFNKISEMIINGELAVDRNARRLYELTEQKTIDLPDTVYRYDQFEMRVADTVIAVDEFPFRLFTFRRDSVSIEMIRNDLNNMYSLGDYRDVTATIESAGDKKKLVYRLSLNQRIRGVEVTGNTIVHDSTLVNMIKQNAGETLNFNKIIKGLDEIKQFYHSNGFSLLRFVDISYKPESGILNIIIEEGRISEIRIEGNELSNDMIILREFPLATNDLYNSKQVKKGIDNIYNTQLFDKVSVNLINEPAGHALIIKVVEKKYNVMRIGGKVGSERGAQIYGEWADENFLGNAHILYLNGRYGDMDRYIGFNYRVDRFFETNFTMNMKLMYDWKRMPLIFAGEEEGEYREQRNGVRFGLGVQLKKLGQISVDLRLENVKVSPFSGDLTESQKQKVTQNSELRTLTVKSVTDKRDDIAFPKSGIYNLWFWETANQNIAQGQEKYTKTYINLEGFYSYLSRHTLHFRGQIGIADQTLPFSEWFRIGGLHDFIGLHESEYFGRQVLIGTIEYRYRLPISIASDLHLAIRYDIGGIWENPDLVLKREDFFNGYGGWIGMNTILGPLFIGYGEMSSQNGIFYISLGYDF